jgi:hypothetical protein
MDLEKAFHSLQSSYRTKVNSILERTHRNESAREDAFPVLHQAASNCRHVDYQAM